MNLDIIAYPMGQFLNFIYKTISFHNYGLSIIFFTVFIRLLLIPLTIKQYHSTAKMQVIQPQMQEIQKRYKTDKVKQNEEIMKLYQENKVNPAGGCLPLIVQMPILIALYWVISSPLKFMLNISPGLIGQLGEIAKTANNTIRATNPDIGIIMYFKSLVGNIPANITDIVRPEQIESIRNFNLEFLGINLGIFPSYQPSLLFGATTWHQYIPLLLIPILVAGTTFLQSKVMSKMQAGQTGAAVSMQNSMMVIMPIMLLLFSFSVPAGLGLYWIIGNVIQIFTQIYINKMVMNKKETAKDLENKDDIKKDDVKLNDVKGPVKTNSKSNTKKNNKKGANKAVLKKKEVPDK